MVRASSPIAYSEKPSRSPSQKTLLWPVMALFCRAERRNTRPFAEELRSLPAKCDIGVSCDGRTACRPHAAGYVDDGPSRCPSRALTLPMTARPRGCCEPQWHCPPVRGKRSPDATRVASVTGGAAAGDGGCKREAQTVAYITLMEARLVTQERQARTLASLAFRREVHSTERQCRTKYLAPRHRKDASRARRKACRARP